jgi:hypothetical protein
MGSVFLCFVVSDPKAVHIIRHKLNIGRVGIERTWQFFHLPQHFFPTRIFPQRCQVRICFHMRLLAVTGRCRFLQIVKSTVFLATQRPGAGGIVEHGSFSAIEVNCVTTLAVGRCSR